MNTTTEPQNEYWWYGESEQTDLNLISNKSGRRVTLNKGLTHANTIVSNAFSEYLVEDVGYEDLQSSYPVERIRNNLV